MSERGGIPDHPLPFLDHLEEFRQALLRALAAFVLAFIPAVLLTPHVIEALSAPFRAMPEMAGRGLQSIQVAGAFLLAMKTAAVTALLLAAPFMAYHLLRFLFPALTRRERHALLAALVASSVLFIAGSLLAYRTTLRMALAVMWRVHRWIGAEPAWTINSYVGFSLHLLLAFGLAFQLPVLVLVLGRMSMVTSRQLRARRAHVILGIFILAMLLTPPDPLTQLMLAVPLAALYEACIWLIAMFEISRGKNHHEEYMA